MQSLTGTFRKQCKKGVDSQDVNRSKRGSQMIQQVKFSAPINRIPSDDILKDLSKEYIVRVSFSSPEEDMHGTCMDKGTTLVNFLNEANAGVMACYSHVKECPMGITSNASQDDNGILYCDFSLDRDLPLSHKDVGFPNSEQVIRQIHNGRITKTSIGGVGGDLICNICDKSMTSWSPHACWEHYPKEYFQVDDPNDPKKKISVKCTPAWTDLHLAELSAVWAGSNLQSEILKQRAVNMLERGVLTKDRILRMNSMWGFELDVKRAKPESTIIDMGGNTTMTAEEQAQFDAMKAERDAANAAKEKAENEKKALEGDSNALKREKSDLIKECSDLYRTRRGDHYTAREGADYEETLEKLDLHEIKIQRNILDGTEEPEEGNDDGNNQQVQAGDKTRQPNQSRQEGTEGSDSIPMPSWFNRGAPVKVIQSN